MGVRDFFWVCSLVLHGAGRGGQAVRGRWIGGEGKGVGQREGDIFNDDSDMQPCGVELHDNSFCHSFRNFNISLDGPGWAGVLQ